MQNTEDVYTGEEKWVNNDTVECIKRISRGASEVSCYAFSMDFLIGCFILIARSLTFFFFGRFSIYPSASLATPLTLR